MYICQLVGAYFSVFLAAMMLAMSGTPEAVIEEQARRALALGWLFWGFAFWVINFIVLQGLTGSSLGKRICGTMVVREDGGPLGVWLSALRSFGYIVSYVPFGFGFMAIYWNRKAQCWHDQICGTLVVMREPVSKPILLPGPKKIDQVA